MSERTALLAGATGLIGGHVLTRLLADAAYTSVVTLGRRPLGQSHPKLTHHVLDFDDLDAQADRLRADDVFCCLGTTMAKAGSKEAFRRVDYRYPLDLARITLGQGADQYLLVSSLGADPGSLFFYIRVKGEVEAAIAALSFEGVYVFRPSMLTGDRAEKRLGEQIGEAVLGGASFLLRGPLEKYRPTAARRVAEAMVDTALARPLGVHTYEPDTF